MNTLRDIAQFWDANPCGETLVGKTRSGPRFLLAMTSSAIEPKDIFLASSTDCT